LRRAPIHIVVRLSIVNININSYIIMNPIEPKPRCPLLKRKKKKKKEEDEEEEVEVTMSSIYKYLKEQKGGLAILGQ